MSFLDLKDEKEKERRLLEILKQNLENCQSKGKRADSIVKNNVNIPTPEVQKNNTDI